MKKNGFVSMTLVYTFLILFLFLMLAVLNAYSQQNRYRNAIEENINLTINTQYEYCEYYIGQTFEYSYTGALQTFAPKCKGKYQFELWGADGYGTNGGHGAYTSGIIGLNKDTNLYIYVGEAGKTSASDNLTFNANSTKVNASGGGATDVRLLKGISNTEWNYYTSLSSRIMVAGGGGGAYNSTGTAGNAGGFVGSGGTYNSVTSLGGAQAVSDNTHSVYFGDTNTVNETTGVSGGGGGYFAGESKKTSNGGGGSSYISGHTGCVAVIGEGSTQPRQYGNTTCAYNTTEEQCSIHYSKFQFIDTVLIDGSGYKYNYKMNTTTGNMELERTLQGIPSKGDSSKNGYARITFVSEA